MWSRLHFDPFPLLCDLAFATLLCLFLWFLVRSHLKTSALEVCPHFRALHPNIFYLYFLCDVTTVRPSQTNLFKISHLVPPHPFPIAFHVIWHTVYSLFIIVFPHSSAQGVHDGRDFLVCIDHRYIPYTWSIVSSQCLLTYIVSFHSILPPQLYWDVIDIQHYVSLRCTRWWFDAKMYCKRFMTVRLNTSFTS